MSYLALARKYRPRRFADVRGQDHAVRALAHALDGDRLHPAILLTGTRGVGKTTLGRIIAKGLNCERGVSSQPCGECSACREVDEGRFIDLIEIDAASRTKVDDTRALLDNVAYAPVRGRYKVYLIDEVHMLSNASFNALLKTLEEPPPHIKFILATTDPQKLPVTVLSRCLQFSLKRLPTAAIRQTLAEVLQQEGHAAASAALAELARAADGSMRDALSLLDQAIAYAGGGELTAETVEQMLGGVGRRRLLELLEILAAGDGPRLLAALDQLQQAAPDYAALLDALGAQLQRVAVLQILPAAVDEDDDPALPELARQLAPEDVQIYYEIAVHGRRDLPWAPDPRLGFEMSLLRMLAFRPETASSSPAMSGGTAAGKEPPSPRPAPATAGAPPPAATQPAPVAAPLPPRIETAEQWSAAIDDLGLEGFAKQLARNCAWIGRSGESVELALPAQLRHLLTEERRQALAQALGCGSVALLSITVTEAATDTPAAREQQQAEQRQRDAEAAIDSDPAVRALRETFGASLRPGSVQPLD